MIAICQTNYYIKSLAIKEKYSTFALEIRYDEGDNSPLIC